MKFSEAKIKEILLSQSYVSQEDMAKADSYAKTKQGNAIEYLLNEDLINTDIIGQATAEYLKLPYADLNTYPPTAANLALLTNEVAQKYRLVVFKQDKDKVVVTTDSPENKELDTILPPLFEGKKVFLAYSLTEDVDAALFGYRQTLETRFQKIIETQKRVAPQIFEEILKDAIAFRSSDVHLEPWPEEVVVRFRIDGVLHEAGRLPKANYENILNRIKVQASLRLDEHSDTQDGSLHFAPEGGGGADLRVSIAPTLNGEKVVVRILSNYVKDLALSALGLSSTQQELLLQVAKKPFGMILVTGPTGSGKTTTLYSVLKHITTPGVNVTTIEDPVEYKIEGVNQIQVNPLTNLTFAKGLKSIVRQDPDIILVGEIRDQETVEISINAALTGHLLFSTFHANDAATAIPRLLDMGAEPFLLGSTLELLIAQRLVRRICENCRQSYKANKNDLENILPSAGHYFSAPITLYKGKGCSHCGQTGFRGRLAVFEFIKATPEMRDFILRRPSSQEIWNLARKQGSIAMFEDGIDKVKNGLTTIEELLRVAQPPNDKNYGKK